MSRQHFVRLGTLGHVGRFTAVDAVSYPRGSRVILRTARGLEIGEVLSPAAEPNQQGSTERGLTDGSILRGMTVEDQLLEARLEQKRQEAFAACSQLLAERGCEAVLLEVEQIFDGQSLYFHFLGTVPPEVETLVAELAETYDAVAQLKQFGETLEHGCGPGCGTESATGQGCSTCSTGCAISGACGVKKTAAT
jgi:cell fate regulator YaaT (PSP1 superfamily)